jgi:hypothetical protein
MGKLANCNMSGQLFFRTGVYGIIIDTCISIKNYL